MDRDDITTENLIKILEADITFYESIDLKEVSNKLREALDDVKENDVPNPIPIGYGRK